MFFHFWVISILALVSGSISTKSFEVSSSNIASSSPANRIDTCHRTSSISLHLSQFDSHSHESIKEYIKNHSLMQNNETLIKSQLDNLGKLNDLSNYLVIVENPSKKSLAVGLRSNACFALKAILGMERSCKRNLHSAHVVIQMEGSTATNALAANVTRMTDIILLTKMCLLILLPPALLALLLSLTISMSAN